MVKLARPILGFLLLRTDVAKSNLLLKVIKYSTARRSELLIKFIIKARHRLSK